MLTTSVMQGGFGTPPVGQSAYTTDSYTKLLIHSDTSDESTSYSDSSGQNHTVNRNGTVNHDTAQAKIGATSIRFGGTSSDWLNSGNHADWSFGTGDFTIDFWVRWASGDIDTNDVIFQYYNTGSVFQDHMTCSVAATTMNFGMATNNVVKADYTFTIPNSGWTVNKWYHVAIVRNGANLYGFFDGTSVTPNSSPPTRIDANTNFPDQGADLTIGKGHYANRMFKGWIDEFRWSKGIARWTSNFTVA